MPRGNLTWFEWTETVTTRDDVWFRLFNEAPAAEQPRYCPECGAREGHEHNTVHDRPELPCGGWRRPCRLGSKARLNG